jgi:hypothetical protein
MHRRVTTLNTGQNRQDPLAVSACLFDRIGIAPRLRKRVIRLATPETLLQGFLMNPPGTD